MRRFKVVVHSEGEGDDSSGVYLVEASTPEDAMQIAFVMDGGWGKDTDITGLLPLAQSYCEVEEQIYEPRNPQLSA